MADFERKLQQLSKRGTPVGAEELIERIEAELAGDPLVVVTKQREGILMTKTDQPVSTKGPGPGRGIAWALVAFVAVLTVAGLYFAFSGDGSQVVDTVPTPTTTPAPNPVTMTDLEILEAGVAALYSGDAETAAELFELAPGSPGVESYPTDQEIAEEAAYQEVIDGRLTLDCTDGVESGVVSCELAYHNAMTDAIGAVDEGEAFVVEGEAFEVRVSDGQIVAFDPPVHSWMLRSIGTFLSLEGRFDGYEECIFPAPFPASCAAVQTENADAWAEWYTGLDEPVVVENAIEAWFGGDCVTALVMTSDLPGDCLSEVDGEAQMIQYESIIGAQVSVENCVVTNPEAGTVQCDVGYSNAMNEAVGKAPAVITRSFAVFQMALVSTEFVAGGTFDPWYDGDYPQDAELRNSFQAFAEGGELSADYAAAECATALIPECANLILDNLDSWAVWYEANN